MMRSTKKQDISDYIYRNPSPPGNSCVKSPEYCSSPVDCVKSSGNSSHRDSSSSYEELIEPTSHLINFCNRFTRSVLAKESFAPAPQVSFHQFYDNNRTPAFCCWQKQIDISIRRSSTAEVESPSAQVQNTIVIKEENYNDQFDISRYCRRFLRGKKCSDECIRLHRYPRDEGIKCISESSGQCTKGRNCPFLHSKYSSDSDSDMEGSNPPNQLTNALQKQTSPLSKEKSPPQKSSVNALPTEPSVNSSPAMVQVKTEPVEFMETENSHNYENEPATQSVKRNSDTTSCPPAKLIKLEINNCSAENSSSSTVPPVVQSEEGNSSVKGEYSAVAEESLFPESDLNPKREANVNPDIEKDQKPPSKYITITTPQSYSPPDINFLTFVTENYFEPFIQNYGFKSSSPDKYVMLRDYLESVNIKLPNELVYKKEVVWDIHARLFIHKVVAKTDRIQSEDIFSNHLAKTSLKEDVSFYLEFVRKWQL